MTFCIYVKEVELRDRMTKRIPNASYSFDSILVFRLCDGFVTQKLFFSVTKGSPPPPHPKKKAEKRAKYYHLFLHKTPSFFHSKTGDRTKRMLIKIQGESLYRQRIRRLADFVALSIPPLFCLIF